MDEKIQITPLGVKRSLNNFTEIESIIEYIWNGFDAKASIIDINVGTNELGSINSISISDNGSGIDKNKLKEKFTPFFQSEKLEDQIQEKKKSNSTYHGKNGVGRLTFFKFSNQAIWETVFKDVDGKNKKYTITIKDEDLTKYDSTEIKETNDDCGTVVKFPAVILALGINELINELKVEFCWYLILNKDKHYKIIVNGENLLVDNLITEREQGTLKIENYQFDWLFVNWNVTLNKEYSKYYFLTSTGDEKFKEHTTFNKKGDKFYHSLYIKSSFFDEFVLRKEELETEQVSLYQTQNNIYKSLKKELDKIIADKRTPYIKQYSKKIIQDLEDIKAFDYYDTNDIVQSVKKDAIQEFIRELYVIEPKIFMQLNKEQKLTMVRLFDASMSGDREHLFKILEGILDLNSEDKEKLAELLKVTPLNNITKTISFLVDRLKALEYFEKIVYDKDLKANEVNDLQNMLETNYWLFGEQYIAVAQAEDNFVKLVKQHYNVLRNDDGDENSEALKIISNHPDKNKQVDLCCVRQMQSSQNIENIVVEIKHPLKKLTMAHYQQLRKYMDILTSVNEFSADNYKWTFFLIGTEISKPLQDDIDNAKDKGRVGLIFEKNNYQIEIYVRTWKSIFNDYKIKYSSLYNKLALEEKNLIKKNLNKQEIKAEQANLNT